MAIRDPGDTNEGDTCTGSGISACSVALVAGTYDVNPHGVDTITVQFHAAVHTAVTIPMLIGVTVVQLVPHKDALFACHRLKPFIVRRIDDVLDGHSDTCRDVTTGWTVFEGVTHHTRPLTASVPYTLPAESTSREETGSGLTKEAVGDDTAGVVAPFPAKVDMVPLGYTTRMR
jgi:hypothetical protein